MPQVRKDEVRQAIVDAALATFAERGFRGATLADIGAQAGVAAANVYRYFSSKEALFAAAVPPSLAQGHKRLLESSVRSLAPLAHGRQPESGVAAEALLRFWLAHRLEVVILLDRAADTPYARYGERFVRHLLALTLAELRRAHPTVRPSPAVRQVLRQIFENTRRTIAAILHSTASEARIRESIAAFRSYQMAGLSGLSAWLGERR